MCPAAPNDHPVTRQAPRIAYLGPQGSFSEQAILSDPTFVGMELEPASSIVDAVQRVVDGAVAAAVVPLENAVAGRIEATERAIAGASRLVIEREITIAVHLDLLGIAGAELDSIRRVLSFPAATAQCRRFLDERLPAAVIESADSTSSAARRVAALASNDVAAIASRRAGDLYGLGVLAPTIENDPGNWTRFAVVRHTTV